MKFVAFLDPTTNAACVGVLDDARGVLPLRGRAWSGDMIAMIAAGEAARADATEAVRTAAAGAWRPAAETRLLAPIHAPRKNVFCVGRNYKLHILEGARARGQEPTYPKVPEFFSKPPTAVVGHDAPVERHAAHTKMLDYEVELGIVIGRRVRDLTPENAMSAVFGYTVVNDVTARDAQRDHGQWFKGKGFDSSCPMGPCIVTADAFGDPAGHRISLTVNGQTRQDSNTADMLFGVRDILVSLSGGMTLEPGDVIATGTPSGVGFGMEPQVFLQVGDEMVASVEGIGSLRNRIAG
jgi:2-keto-4-pentenoate hydratase/2-oxohepta-3-ene-1,7-dioic acid hydratase in catechol pathway